MLIELSNMILNILLLTKNSQFFGCNEEAVIFFLPQNKIQVHLICHTC